VVAQVMKHAPLTDLLSDAGRVAEVLILLFEHRASRSWLARIINYYDDAGTARDHTS
jgi:hypothetical protein